MADRFHAVFDALSADLRAHVPCVLPGEAELCLEWGTGPAPPIPEVCVHELFERMDQVCSALFAGALLNFSLFLCTLANSALTTTVVGVLKGVASTLLGFFLLGGVKMSGMHVAGIAANTAGGIAYTVASQAEKRRARAAFPK